MKSWNRGWQILVQKSNITSIWASAVEWEKELSLATLNQYGKQWTKDINSSEIPTKMYKENVEIHRNDIPECFAEHFSRKISDLLANIEIDDQVFNGTRKLWKAEQNFMTSENIVKAVQSIKMKNAEGEDRIPQRILIDGISIILSPLTTLCNRLNELNNQVDLDWLHQSLISFKLKMKSLLLMNWHGYSMSVNDKIIFL